MALGEGLVERAERTPAGYAAKVRFLAAIYVALNAVCLAIVVLVLWRGRHLITLAQRSNVETLVLAIVLVLAVFYLATTARGWVGALRIAGRGLRRLASSDRAAFEDRKHRALADGGEPLAVHFDKRVEAESATCLTWPLADEAGSLGEIEIADATATIQPAKRGLHSSVLAFVLGQLNERLVRRSPPERLTIAFWADIAEEESAVYRSTVLAFGRLGAQLGGPPPWPTLRLTADDVAHVGHALRQVVPALRDEALLPDLEYEVEYSVPVLPEPLAFLQLRRTERRADPVLTMGYALVVMTLVLLAVVLLVLFPPWVPSR